MKNLMEINGGWLREEKEKIIFFFFRKLCLRHQILVSEDENEKVLFLGATIFLFPSPATQRGKFSIKIPL